MGFTESVGVIGFGLITGSSRSHALNMLAPAKPNAKINVTCLEKIFFMVLIFLMIYNLFMQR